MSGLDVEALLDSTASSKEQSSKVSANDASPQNGNRSGRLSRDDERDRDRGRDASRDRERRHRSSSANGRATPHSEAGSHRSARRRSRSRSRDSGRRHRRYRGDGDYYRGGNRGGRSRSRSPGSARHYRPRDGYRRRDDDRGSRRGSAGREEETPKLTEDERDRRTVFVQQLAARLRTRDLKEFFERAGPVAEAQIVKDRVSNRSKGVGYVEFEKEESVAAALQLTGQKLLGIPVIVQLTEAEKNRQVRTESTGAHPNQVPFHRLYVGNIHFSITEEDLRNVFKPFGALEFVTLQKDENGRSRGYGFVQFLDAQEAKNALEQMNGFDLAGRPIRVGLGNDKFTPESTANLLHRFQGPNGPGQSQGSAFSGAGGRGHQSSNFDRAGGRDNDKGTGASALDDTDVAGVNFNNYSRDALMRKLARTDEPTTGAERPILRPKTETRPLPVNVAQASRCIVLKNMFNPAEQDGDEWIKDLEDDVRTEAEAKYGHVIHIAVDPNSDGEIYLKFDKIAGGENAIKGLNGRFFDGRTITAQPVVDAVYSSLFSRAKAI